MESMKDFEKEINESLEKVDTYNDELAGVWEQFEVDRENETVFNVKITEVVDAGAITSLNEVRAFIPISHISTEFITDIKDYVGKSLDVVIITADREKNRLVLSHKVLGKKLAKEEVLKNLENIKVGDRLLAKVERFKDYGAFVLLENNISALLHISEISHKRVKSVEKVLKEGDEIEVQVIGIDGDKVSVSKKALEEKPGEFKEFKKEKATFEYNKEKVAISTSLGSLLSDIKF